MELVEALCITSTAADFDYYAKGTVYTLDWDYAKRKGIDKHFEVSRVMGQKEATERFREETLPGQLKKGTVSGMDPTTFSQLSHEHAKPSVVVSNMVGEQGFGSDVEKREGPPPVVPSDGQVNSILTGGQGETSDAPAPETPAEEAKRKAPPRKPPAKKAAGRKK